MRFFPLALLLALPGYAADATDVSATPRRQGLKPEAVAALKAALPKYVAPKTVAAPASAEDETPEELPGGILRLPEYFVTEDKIRAFSEYEMLTVQGRIDLALKRHPGLKLGPFAGLNAGPGLAMLAEEEAIAKRRRAAELFELASFSRSTPDKKLREALRQVQLRPQP